MFCGIFCGLLVNDIFKLVVLWFLVKLCEGGVTKLILPVLAFCEVLTLLLLNLTLVLLTL